jgi:hypothetical protein
MIHDFKLLKKETVNRKLLDYGFFSEKLIEIFQSKEFGQWVRKTGIKTDKKNSFSSVKYRQTRNNNAPRIFEIPHPIAYFRLCEEIKLNWDKIIHKIGEIDDYVKRSMIIPQPNNVNGRLVSMLPYDRKKDEKFLILNKSYAKRYFVHLDIANFYPSVYSHSIPWALVGHKEAKDNSRNDDMWYNKLDIAIRSMQRNETIGIPIGPDTSSIICELILSRVDKELVKYDYVRFIDDFKCYCKSKDEADEFIRNVSKELEKYNLRLNPKKTEIIELPIAIGQDWIRILKDYSLKFSKKEEFTNKDINALSEFIDLSIRLFKENPNDSPIKYAVKILSRKHFTEEKVLGFVLMYLSRICFIYPYFMDVFNKILANNKNYINENILNILEDEINSITEEHLKYFRSDVALWGLKLATEYKFEIRNFENYSNTLINERDCIPTLLCYEYSKAKNLNTTKYFKLIDELRNEKLEDEWWIFIYQLYREKPNKPEFKAIRYKEFYKEMRVADITFLKRPKITRIKKNK